MDIRNGFGTMSTIRPQPGELKFPYVAMTTGSEPINVDRVENGPDGPEAIGRFLSGERVQQEERFPLNRLTVPVVKMSKPQNQEEADLFFTVAPESAPFLKTHGVVPKVRFDVIDRVNAILRTKVD